jgi:hypothetical protein
MFLHVLVDRTDVWREAVDIAIRPTALPDLIRPDVSARVNRPDCLRPVPLGGDSADWAAFHSAISIVCSSIPYTSEQGIVFVDQGIFPRDQRIS